MAGADDGSGFDAAAGNLGAVVGADIGNGIDGAIGPKKSDLIARHLEGHMFAFSEQ